MAWLDLVLALPVVGVRVKPRVTPAMDHVKLMAPVVDHLIQETGDADFGSDGPASFELKTTDGFIHVMTLENLTVQFAYPTQRKRKAGELPIIELPKRVAFSDLLATACSRAIRLLRAFPPGHDFIVNRLGIMAVARLTKDSLPPGLVGWLKELKAPWTKELIKIDCNFVAKLSSSTGQREQCHHILTFDEGTEPKDEIQVKLDWQRIYEQDTPLRIRELEAALEDVKTKALAYFEGVGVGGLLR